MSAASEFDTVKKSVPPSHRDHKTTRKTKINLTLFRINEMALGARLILEIKQNVFSCTFSNIWKPDVIHVIGLSFT